MTDLAAFLSARIDEDEAAARQSADSTLDLRFVDADADSEQLIWRFDPDRVLREVEAKRKILAWWERADQHPAPSPTYKAWLQTLPAYREVLLPLAAVYADHPDYDPEWSKA